MQAEFWLILTASVVVAIGVGVAVGRATAPTQRRVEEMEKERDAARVEAETVRKEVNRHFEESAQMFGKLASDYRSFFQQFARTAQNLGLSDGRARELLQQADPSLVASDGAAQRPAADRDAEAVASSGGERSATPRENTARDGDVPGTAEPEARERGPDDAAPEAPRHEEADVTAQADTLRKPEEAAAETERAEEPEAETRRPEEPAEDPEGKTPRTEEQEGETRRTG